MTVVDRGPTAAPPPRAAVVAVFGCAFAVRLGSDLLVPGMHHPDEMFQS